MAQQSFSFAIFSQSNQSFLGVCSLQSVGDEPKRFSLGFWLRSSAHGQGYATEAGRTLIDFAFKTLGVKQIYAHHAAENRASQRVLERLGFSLYEIKPKAHKLYDDYVDEYRYTLSDIAALHR